MTEVSGTADDIQPFPGDSLIGNARETNYSTIADTDNIQGRPRSNTMSSIRSGLEIVREHMDRRKFIYLVLASVSIYLAFVAAFAPRTSLSRDLRRFHSAKFTPSEVYRIYLDALLLENRASDHLDSLATAEDSSEYIIDYLDKLGFTAQVERFYPWTNQPKEQQLRVFNKNKRIYEAKLKESLSNVRQQAFHSYSKDGKLRSRFVYCNYCSKEDYELLLEKKADIEGKVHLCRYGKLAPGNKLKNAELYGSSGVLLFNHDEEDGSFTTLNGYKRYPEGPARPKDAIQRDTVRYGSDIFGDPTTPGYASYYSEIEREAPDKYLPSIPSLAISPQDRNYLLSLLDGKGVDWGLSKGERGYYSGPSNADIEIELINEQQYGVSESKNIVVEIPGILSDSEIIVGAHRVAFEMGNGAGASSSHSGTSVLLEMARGLSKLQRKGWRPLRTIKIVSWDGKNGAQLGSSNYGSKHSVALKRGSLLYINLDKAVTGKHFKVNANPMLKTAIKEASKYVGFKLKDDWSLFDEWQQDTGNKIDPIEGEVDYSVFQYFLGIPVVSFKFSREVSDTDAFPINTAYDIKDYLLRFIDPDLQLHNTLSRYLGMFVLMTSERELSYYNPHSFLTSVKEGYEGIHKDLTNIFYKDDKIMEKAKQLRALIVHIADNDSKDFERRNREVYERCTTELPIWAIVRKLTAFLNLSRANRKLRRIGSIFLTYSGIDGRPLMKSSLFAPSVSDSRKIALFPGLYDAVQATDIDRVWRALIILEAHFRSLKYVLS
ncbi:putative zinc metalloprotease [Nakaseomyces bracarensis]|uniref:putative zinc metalloprotease n=1 Tax=Nakaseomyces bracarensis TaxID=273131 RepID=UPI003872692A